MKKMMLLALAAVSALLVVPAGASALPAHLSANPGNFTVHGGASALSRAAGGGTHSATVTGTGSFQNTTTGTVKLTFHGSTNSLLGSCTTSGQPSGTIATTTLPFHLVMLGSQPGILITPAAGSNHFASFNCGFVGINVRGDGILGTITSPGCGQASNKATINFSSNGAGVQNHLTYTGETYDLESSLFGSYSTSAMDAHATISFASSPTLICTS